MAYYHDGLTNIALIKKDWETFEAEHKDATCEKVSDTEYHVLASLSPLTLDNIIETGPFSVIENHSCSYPLKNGIIYPFHNTFNPSNHGHPHRNNQRTRTTQKPEILH